MRIVVVAITLAAATAHADPKQLVAEAEALATAGDFLGAAAKYRAAYKAEPLPEHICNTGVAYHKAQDLPRSHRYLNLCVTMGSALDPAYRETLKKTVDAIQQKLVTGEFTPIDIAVDPPTAAVTFEGGKPFDEELVGGGRIWVPYGTYRLVIRAGGYLDATKDVTASSHDAIPLRVNLEKPPHVPTYVDAPQPSKLPAIATAGVAGGLGIAALVFWVQARGLADDADATADRAEFEDLHADAHDKQRVSWILGGVAGATALVSAYLWYRVVTTPARIEVTATGEGAGVSIRGRF